MEIRFLLQKSPSIRVNRRALSVLLFILLSQNQGFFFGKTTCSSRFEPARQDEQQQHQQHEQKL
jgi:hypothetical protein